MAVGMKRGREGPIPGLYPAPSKGHLGLRTSLPRLKTCSTKVASVQFSGFTKLEQHGACLCIRHSSSGVVKKFWTAIYFEPVGIQLVSLQVSAVCYNNAPRASKNGVRHYSAVTSCTEAGGNVPLPVVVTLNGLAVVFQPISFRFFAKGWFGIRRAVQRPLFQIIHRRRPVGCIRETAHCGHDCQRQNLPHYPFPPVAVTCTIKRPQTRVKGFHAPSFIHG